ncbi:MAG TPA: GNAT family N-acetyltransferase [Anaerolineales bacterium]|nr:GNAT family N-acetyltransferase [Anaerolineales bacterium]
MDHFSLREATQDDSAAIRALVLEGGINPTGLDWTRFVVAEDQSGTVVGCGQLKPHRDGSLELASLAVKETQRGRGVARALIEQLIAHHDGILYLMCRSGLGPLYEKFGFYTLEYDEMPRYFQRVSKLVGVLNAVRKTNETLLVMCRVPD